MKKFTLIVFIVATFFGATFVSRAQVGIGTTTPHTSAMLDVNSSSKGLLIPRLTTAQRNALGATAAAGLMVYDTDQNKYYYYNGSGWLVGTTGEIWSTDGTYDYLVDPTDNVGIGTSSPFRKLDIYSSSWRTARIATSMDGPFLEFVGAETTDWSVGTWGNAFWIESSDDEFSTTTDQFKFTKNEFYPFTTNSKTLGMSSNRWSNIFSTNGDFSGVVGIGTTSPVTPLEVFGPWKTARLNSATSGSMLEFASSSTTDFAIGTWTNSLRILSTTNDFSTTTDEYYITTSEFSPFNDNVRTLGASSRKWSNIFGVLGSFSGTVSIGTTTHQGNLIVHDGTNTTATVYITPENTASGDSSLLFLAEDHDASYGMYWLYDGLDNEIELWGKAVSTNYGPWFRVKRDNGNVAIGTTYATGYKLSVDGKIICTELRVNLVADWPDYVFRKGYSLMPVDKLGDFIEKNGHLPNIPCAAEVEKSGMDVGEMQKKMMEKIEELSLYIIDQQKQIRELQERLDKQAK